MPQELPVVKHAAHFFEVVSDERLSAGDDNVEFMSVNVWKQRVDDFDEIFSRHIGEGGCAFAVTSAVFAGQIASPRAFPEKLAKGMLASQVARESALHFERDALPY